MEKITVSPSTIEREIPKNYGDAAVQLLEQLGCRAAFGIPGGPVIGMFSSLSQSKVIESSLSQHEGGGAYAAFGRSMAAKGREVPVCYATAGPGLTNALTGVASAFHERVPLFFITGNVARHLRRKGAVQDSFAEGTNAVEIFKHVTLASEAVEKEGELLPKIEKLYRLALEGRGPVHLSIPVDITTAKWTDSKNDLSRITEIKTNLVPSEEMVRKVDESIRAFLTSERPLVFSGNGVKLSGLGRDLAQMCEQFQLPVMETSHAKGTVDPNYPHFLGTFGIASSDQTDAFIERYRPTAILFLGTSLGECSTAAWSPIFNQISLRIQVDLDADRLERSYSMQYPIQCRLEYYLRSMSEIRMDVPLKWLSAVEAAKRSDRKPPELSHADDSGRVHPQHLVRAVVSALPKNGILVSDIGNSMLWALQEFYPGADQEFYVPMSLGAMGSGIGAAVGIQSYDRERPVVCLIGDCAMLMQGNELITAREMGLPLKIIVLNDGGHGTVEHGLKLLGMRNSNVRFSTPIDFKAMGAAFGIPSYRISLQGELDSNLLKEVFMTNTPALIEAMIDPTIPPPLNLRVKGLEGRGVPGLISPDQ